MKSLFYYRSNAVSKMGIVRKETNLGLFGNLFGYGFLRAGRLESGETFVPVNKEVIFPKNSEAPHFNMSRHDKEKPLLSIRWRTLAIACIVTVLSFLCIGFFSSCSSDEDDVVKDTNFMVNTKWYTKDPLYDTLFGTKDGPNYVILDFSSKSNVEWYVIQNKQVKSVLSTMTYKCKDGNTVEITSDGGTAVYSVSGKQMKKTNEDGLRYTSFTVWTD